MNGTNIEKLSGALTRQAKSHVKVQTCWVTAEQVDWEEKTMTAVGLADNLEFYGISLGLGGLFRKPKAGTACLIGLIENQAAAAFLIDAEEVEETVFHGGENGGMVKVKELSEGLEENNRILTALLNALSTPVTEAGNGAPSAFQAKLKIAMAGMQVGDFARIENKQLKH